ncbi:unnamed protein product, partial [marine sediment metagenome]
MKSRVLLSILVIFLILVLAGCGVVPPLNQSPIASFTANPNSGIVPLEVFFNASSSYDPDGTIVSYVWDFEDGNTGTGETINHTFSSTGSFNVELTVTDNEGAIDSTTKLIITVTESEPSGDVVITLDNWDQEYYESLGEWSSYVYAYYTISNNSTETVYDYKIYFTVNCIDDSVYYDSWYEG